MNEKEWLVHDIKEFLKTHPISELLEVVADAVKDKEQNQ